MEKFNINKIIERYKLDTDELAKVLFPYIKYPKQAFDRVLRGEANLDTSQVENLASYAGVLVCDLYKVEDWKGIVEDTCLTFIKGNYKVKLNYNGAYLTFYKDEQVLKQEISCVYSMTVLDFIKYINNLIQEQDGTN